MTRRRTPEQLWDGWLENHDRPTRDALVEHYQPLVREVAVGVHRTVRRLDVDELVSHGQFGLLDALNRYDPGLGPFPQYARRRIRGAIFDGMRSFDPVSRDHRDQIKQLHQATDLLRARLGREPTDREVAGVMGVSESEVHQTRSTELAVAENVLDDSFDVPSTSDDLDERIDLAEFTSTVAAAFERVDGPERVVLGLYYVDRLRMADIARVMGVSTAMVSKLHTQAVQQLRQSIEDIGSSWAP